VTRGRDFDGEYKEAKEGVKEVADKSSVATFMKMTMQKYKAKAEASDDHSCPLCSRGHDSDDQFAAFIKDLDDKIEGFSDDRIERQLKAAQQRLDDLERVKQAEVNRVRYNDVELPPLQQKLATIASEIDGLTKEVRVLDSEMLDADTKVTDAEALGGVCSEVQQLTRTMDELAREVRLEESKLAGTGVDSAKTLDEVANDLSDANDRRDQLDKKIERVRSDRQAKQDAVKRAERDKNTANEKLLTATAEAAKRTAFENTLKELKADEAQAQREIADRRKEENPLQDKLDDANAEAQTEKRDYHQRVTAARREKDELTDSIKTIGTLTDSIERYERQGTSDAVQKSEAAIEDLENKLTVLADEEEEQQKKTEALRIEIANVESQERSIRDNIQFRTQTKELAALKKRQQALEADCKACNADGVQDRRIELHKQQQKLEETKNHCKGQMQTLAGKLKEHQRELRDPIYRDAEETFRKKTIEFKTTEMANKDLNTYYQALDRAVMQYHALKMSEINVIIKELWATTYQGKDIDTIEILSEDESSAAKKSDASARKSYKYRVVMVKGKVKVDMRGRCSAGQKVLSSIIIRLALAETFCLSCGILTLDEPTTNLDEANIASLADALAKIIADRRKQANFQMIVITHDEKFVRKLGIGGVADTYYKVFKNAGDDGKICSQIRRHEMSELDV
jgi:DNA repair protein RAD50